MQRRTLLGSIAAAAVGSTVPATASSGPKKGGNRPSPPSSSNSARNSDILPTGTERIAETFYNQVEQELHHGAQLAVYHEDELVLNIAGGTTGPDGAEETTDTRHVLFSTTKPYTAGTVHYLVDEGLVDYDDYVVDHWPDFARGDERKAEVTIRHVLSHQSGLYSIPAIDDYPEIWGDPDEKEVLVEKAETAYEPGTRTDYHLLSYGWIIDGLTRNVVGKQIDELAEESIFDPLGMDNTSIGVADASEVDVATLVGFEPYNQITEPDSPGYTSYVADLFNWDRVQESVVGAATGIGTARDLARYYNCLLNNGEDVFSNRVARAFTSVEVEQEENGEYSRRGLGVRFGGEPGDDFGMTASHGVYGHGGLGSIMSWADPDNDIAFAYVTNGIRDGYEHSQRVARLGDTVRHELS
ncbi:serine hydrolase domain-containing protein [Natrinema salsiterrestre]|uniref:Beta-lactamase family protein n=1 Tax=Natrinema salsiterrestre TaxID=2950540 RepID=A0A9Q4Q2F9_9EURY|nr:serine hydrolase domain-containing protein [Natrinema salsiterrestre]MDF9748274.1 beta-lactamase family protein [Natrinema salsiterrestre]